MSRKRFDADEWYRRRYHHGHGNNALWENREALDKYLARLRELMAAGGDESAIKSIEEEQKRINEGTAGGEV